MKFLIINGKIQTLGGKPIVVPDDYDNDIIKISGKLVKTGTGLIGSKHSGDSEIAGTENFISFSSPSKFYIKTENVKKNWDGIIEYSIDTTNWIEWDGRTTINSVVSEGGNVLYLRGIGNTVITGDRPVYRWVLGGTDIKCFGNIENLLDYAIVESGEHPTMGNYCYASMFYNCANLTQAPTLPAITLAESCYENMFYGCTSLTQAPELPATTLADNCYYGMFGGCTSLTQAPELPATTLAISCYCCMFYGCTSLTQIPALPATTLADMCYVGMFADCISIEVSETLTDRCT